MIVSDYELLELLIKFQEDFIVFADANHRFQETCAITFPLFD
jgi:hypothetical protein